MLNILFMGTPDFAQKSLEAIYNKKHNIVGVVTTPDRPNGRGMKIKFSPVKEYALSKKLKIYQPEKIKENIGFINEIKALNPDVICVVAYGMILPKEILEIPKLGCINLHPSLLPKYRGSAPIQWAIINGDKKTGITTIYINEKMDAGDIILKKEIDIEDNETTGQLWDRLAIIGAELLLETLDKIENNTVSREKQGDKFVLAPMINKQDAKIDWNKKTALEIKNLVRGLNPVIGAYSNLNGKQIKFWKVEEIKTIDFINKYEEFKEYEYRFSSIEPGTVLYVDDKEGLYIKAKDEIILLLEVQAENSKKMNIVDFLRGNKIEVIDCFK